MAKEDLIEMSGQVLEVLPDARYRVKLDNGHELVAYTNGKMRKHQVQYRDLMAQDADSPFKNRRTLKRSAPSSGDT